jgi:hypothetical protein
MKRHRLRPLESTLQKLRAHPFTNRETRALWTVVAAWEEEVEVLGQRAEQERRDVDWVEHPVVRAWLWATGSLEERTARERSEADAAMAATLARGDQARRLRDWLEDDARGIQGVRDERVADDLARVSREDLRHFPEDGAELEALWERVHRAQALVELGGEAARIGDTIGRYANDTRRGWLRGRLQRLQIRLGRLGLPDLAPDLGRPSLTVWEARGILKDLRRELGRRARLLRAGLAGDLMRIVRRHLEAEVPVLAAVEWPPPS